jgi:hypothetical protein
MKQWDTNKQAMNDAQYLIERLDAKGDRLRKAIGKKRALSCPAYRRVSLKASKCLLSGAYEIPSAFFDYVCSCCHQKNIAVSVLRKKLEEK